ncbi:ABC transporter substrate-binding protein, partial [Rhodopseudomonas palustris]
DDPGAQRYHAFMAKYYPDGDAGSSFNVYGYITAQLLVHVLQQCGDDLTRANVMKQATHMTNVALDMLLPGISITTTPTDYRVNKQFQMARFNGEGWERFGPIIADTAKE